MGKNNKTVKLTPRKIGYIIRYKTNNYSTKSIAKDLKISESTVKRVWTHCIKTKTLLNINEFGRKKKELDKASEDLILKIKEQNLGARRLEEIIEFTHGKRIPHNAIHKVLTTRGQAKKNPNKSKRRKPWNGCVSLSPGR